ncbi:MAG: hypothetical protein NTY01_23855 [Verrucomicrobia bacterium]|nr:hypothetical protein [Verrucomicrobiota bacterium]
MKIATIFGSFLAGALAAALGATVTLTSSDIVKMSKAGISDDVIIQTIQSTGSNFHLTAEDVESIKRDGVSDRLVAAMQTARPAAPSAATPVAPPVPVVREPSGRDYVGGLVDQPIVRALPVAPPVYYEAPPTTIYYYSYPCYYPAPRYYCGPPVRFYFGYGGGRRHCR